MSDSAQHIRVHGLPIFCQSHGCQNDAVVMLRYLEDDGSICGAEVSIAFCEDCWRRRSNAYWIAEFDTNCTVQITSGDEKDYAFEVDDSDDEDDGGVHV